MSSESEFQPQSSSETTFSKPFTGKRWNFFSLIQLNSSLFCIQLVFAIEFSFLAPYFHALGVPSSIYPFVWLAGPFSGLVTQPIVGVYSDWYSSKWGKRRPFILVGMIAALVGMILLGFSVKIGYGLGDNPKSHSAAIAVSILALWIINIALNIMMGPARALIGDIVPADQQTLGNGIASFMIAFASLCGNALGAIDLLTIFPFFASQFQAMFLIASIFIILSTLPTLIIPENDLQIPKANILDLEESTNKSNPARSLLDESNILMSNQQDYETSRDKKAPSVFQVFNRIWKASLNMSPAMRKIVICYFFSWAAASPFFVYISLYTAQNIYHGNSADVNHDGPTTKPQGKDYLAGLRFGALALTIQAAVVMVYASFIDGFVKLLSVRGLYAISQTIFSSLCICFLFVTEKWTAFTFIIIAGFQLGTINSIPFALTAENVDSDLGLYMGVLNLGSVFGQIISNFIAGLFIHLFNNNVAAAIAIGGIWGFIGLIAIRYLPIKNRQDDTIISDSSTINSN